jgi:hypothetical protein
VLHQARRGDFLRLFFAVFWHMVFIDGFFFPVKELGLLNNSGQWIRVLDVMGSYIYIYIYNTTVYLCIVCVCHCIFSIFIKNIFVVIYCTRSKYTFDIRVVIGFRGMPLWLRVCLRFLKALL